MILWFLSLVLQVFFFLVPDPADSISASGIKNRRGRVFLFLFFFRVLLPIAFHSIHFFLKFVVNFSPN